jgi:outer membrane immunogenic protein
MRLGIRSFVGWLLAVAAVSPGLACAQARPAPDPPLRSEAAFDYTYVHSNAPPGGCGCFNMNGGSGSYAWQLKPERWAIVGDVTVDHASGISSSGYTLTLSTFTAGMRYLIPVGEHALRPFGQALIGAAHGSGSLVEGYTPAAQDQTVFAANLGGGVDLRAGRHFAVRLIDANWLVTVFDNSDNNRQNNMRLSTGVVLRF